MATAPPIPKSFEDAQSLHAEVEEELERVCSAPHFRTSKRACEFLRYIVRVTLDGRMDSLKERSIGIDLLGRDVSYDPSSDAIVRVRANDVRKRLASYYASLDTASAIQIHLPLGSYIPTFIPHDPSAEKPAPAPVPLPVTVEPIDRTPGVLPLSNMAMMRPALLALLLCILLMRHRLEDRESYLRFWDHVLSGRNLLILTINPQDEIRLAHSLYPIAWIAGRYGVDTAIEENVPSGTRPEQLASVQESLGTPAAIARDKRLRWVLTDDAQGSEQVTDRASRNRIPQENISAAAVLTILPEDSSTLHVQGTDGEAIEHLLDDLTSQKHFPDRVVDELGGGKMLQILMLRTSSGQWSTQIFEGDTP
ncbi:MAG TPA: hypothetical protein VGB69_05960 [Edaphobacter sp.]